MGSASLSSSSLVSNLSFHQARSGGVSWLSSSSPESGGRVESQAASDLSFSGWWVEGQVASVSSVSYHGSSSLSALSSPSPLSGVAGS